MSASARALPPGQPQPEHQAAELTFWQSHLAHWDLHLPSYLHALPFSEIDFARTAILDVGSGPISVFEKVAPPSARVTGYDSLADEYNRLARDKRFPIVGRLPAERFGLITSFNCLDHMDRPDELLAALAPALEPGGRLWIYCHIGRPYGADAHPQDFRFWHLVTLTNRPFQLLRCGLVREGRLFPYAWWGICRDRSGRRTLLDWPREAFWNTICAVQFAYFHGVRALVKGLKIIGLRRILPEELRF
jgi:SAM-dependent methyltransferase